MAAPPRSESADRGQLHMGQVPEAEDTADTDTWREEERRVLQKNKKRRKTNAKAPAAAPAVPAAEAHGLVGHLPGDTLGGVFDGTEREWEAGHAELRDALCVHYNMVKHRLRCTH